MWTCIGFRIPSGLSEPGYDFNRLGTVKMLEKIKGIQNPLTIIALFAGLSEVAGTVALATVNKDLQHVFVWFVMGFPTLLVILFFLTLNFNARSLYAPSDFRSDERFLELQGIRFGKRAEQARAAVDIRGAYDKLAASVNGTDAARAAEATLRRILTDAGYTPAADENSAALLADLRKAMADASNDNDKLTKLSRAVAAADVK